LVLSFRPASLTLAVTAIAVVQLFSATPPAVSLHSVRRRVFTNG
jgi:hypothetical protein